MLKAVCEDPEVAGYTHILKVGSCGCKQKEHKDEELVSDEELEESLNWGAEVDEWKSDALYVNKFMED